MKANEFVKKFGWDRAKREVALIGTIAMMCGDNDFNNDLKRLVESHELVEKHGGIDSLNDLFCVHGMSSARVMAVNGLTYADAMQAIADVESCQ